MRVGHGIAACLILFVCVTTPAAAAPPICKAPRVLVVLDRSSSMADLCGTQTKWSVAKSALTTVLQTYQGTIDFGLMSFPNPDQCSPGKLQVPVGPNAAAAILAMLGPAPLVGVNGTPMAQTLDVAATLTDLLDAGYSSHVLLITDGQQQCLPYDPNTRFLPVSSVGNLAALGIKTHVVGFGDKVDALVLNQMATAAGTEANTGCNASSSSAAAPDNCYYQAHDPQQLVDALKTIAKNVSVEVCDGLDNDCNGTVDDGLAAPPCEDQDGVCQGAAQLCGGAGGWRPCTAADYQAHAAAQGRVYQEQEALCDGLDNDCDGTVDEGCACIDGEIRPCGTSVGVCVQGTQRCEAGVWLPCAADVGPVPEACDGQDNDCDGQTDEGLTRSCSSICGAGQQLCVGGKYTDCIAPLPSPEVCDGQDNDCDGEVDGPDAYCANGGVCVNGECRYELGGAGATPHAAGGSGCDCDVARPGSTTPPVSLALVLIFGALILLATRRA